MTEEINGRQRFAQAERAAMSSQPSELSFTDSRVKTSRTGFNRYIYENLLCHLEGQIETWNRMAVREPNPEVAHTLWHKAEGLGYALRLLYAFEPEFRELVDFASRAPTDGTTQRQVAVGIETLKSPLAGLRL